MRRALAALALLVAATAAAAQDDSARIEALEQRVEQLEAELGRARSGEHAPAAVEGDWTERIALSGSAELGHYDGGPASTLHDAGYRVWDARLFLDAELAEDVRFGSRPLVRNVGFTAEWNLVRLGEVQNDVGELYLDLQGVAGSSWLNLRPGRFHAPVGEAYARYGREAARDPFVSHPAGSPWWWDEGVMLYGASGDDGFGYVASVANGETPFGYDDGGGEQTTLKLWLRPLSWLYASASALRGGEVGYGTAALWLGETWGRPVGSDTEVPTWIDGVARPDAPPGFDESWLLAGDLVLTPHEAVRLWLAYGYHDLDAEGGSLYDRALQYGIAEMVLRGTLVAPELAPAYLGLRADALGTFDDGRGFLLDYGYASRFGDNLSELWSYSAVVGWQLGRFTTLRAEYSLRDLELVEGVPGSMRDDARHADGFAVELGIQF
jgi:hypothetical protein